MDAHSATGTGLRSVDDQLRRVLESLSPLSPYNQPLLEATGLPIAEEITSPIDLPRFSNSAMDGYAVRYVDVAETSQEHPVQLPVVGEAAAGASQPYALAPGTSMRIMTGAPLPNGADCVIPVEATDNGRANVTIFGPPQPSQHVRYAGEDVRAGEVVLEEGAILDSRETGLVAAVGRSSVQARPRPRVVIMSTGSELREPDTALDYDSIYDANSYMLAAAAKSADAIPYRVGIVSDEPHEFGEALSDQLVRADLVVTSGGVSKGDYDVVKDVLSRLGTVEFTEVAMQPGKPQGFGFVGEDQTPIFTLPGNPVSAFVSFEVFVVPALRRLMGRLPYRRPLVRARLTDDVTAPQGRRTYVRAHFEVAATGATVTPVRGQSSHRIGSLARSNCLVVVPEETTTIAADETVNALVLDRTF